MRRICIYAFVALLGSATPIFMAQSASAQQVSQPDICQNNVAGTVSDCLVFAALGAGLVAAAIIVATESHHHYQPEQQVSP